MSEVICLNASTAKQDNAFLATVDLDALAEATGYSLKRLQRWQRGETAIPATERKRVLQGVNHLQGFKDKGIANHIAKAQKAKNGRVGMERQREILRERMSAITDDWWNRVPAPDEGVPGGPRFNKNRSITDSPSTGPDRIVMKMMADENLIPKGILTQADHERTRVRANEIRSLVRGFLAKRINPTDQVMRAMRSACDAVMDFDRRFFDAQCEEAARLYGIASPAFEYWQSVRPAWMGPWKTTEPDPASAVEGRASDNDEIVLMRRTAASYGAMEGVVKVARHLPALLPFEEMIRRAEEASRRLQEFRSTPPDSET
jgi:hypothetical protein